MTIAEHVYAQWAVLQPRRVLFSAGRFMDPDCAIPVAKGPGFVGRWSQWHFDDGSVIYRDASSRSQLLSLQPHELT